MVSLPQSSRGGKIAIAVDHGDTVEIGNYHSTVGFAAVKCKSGYDAVPRRAVTVKTLEMRRVCRNMLPYPTGTE